MQMGSNEINRIRCYKFYIVFKCPKHKFTTCKCTCFTYKLIKNMVRTLLAIKFIVNKVTTVCYIERRNLYMLLLRFKSDKSYFSVLIN